MVAPCFEPPVLSTRVLPHARARTQTGAFFLTGTAPTYPTNPHAHAGGGVGLDEAKAAAAADPEVRMVRGHECQRALT